jgi:hypothetical protein
MKCKKWVLKIYFLLFLFIKMPLQLFAQSEEELPKQYIYDEDERAYYWVPTLLNANTKTVSNFAQYNGFIFNWLPRGQARRTTIINGLVWDSKLSGWNSSFSYANLYKTFKRVGSAENYEFNELGFEESGYANYLLPSNSFIRKGFAIETSISNGPNFSTTHFEFNSGELKKNWWLHAIFASQETPNGILPQGYRTMTGASFSAEKIFSKNQTLNLLFWWNNSNQGKTAPSVKEAFDLYGQRNYNPSWGWLNGQAYFPNSKQNNTPVLSLMYSRKYKEKTILQFSLGIANGTQSSSELDWNKTADPRPDYYRYLPSYSKDSATKQGLINFYEQNPQALLINFNQIQKINQRSASKRAYYIVNKKISAVSILRASFQMNSSWNDYWSWSIGAQFSNDRIRHYDVLDNLLGGLFYFNYNGWVNDDGIANNFQNDIQYPNRQIKVGDTWGANYILNNIHFSEWVQIKNEKARWEFSLGINSTQDYFNREGMNQNSLFPKSSLGISPMLTFPGYGIKGQLLYKMSGRFYARAIMYNQETGPTENSIYINPSLMPNVNPYLLPVLTNGIDLTLFYRGVNTKFTASYFLRNELNDLEKKLFYHDKYAAFVYGVVGQMQKHFHGIEASMEASLFQKMQVTIISTMGQYTFVNNPMYQILLVNDLYKIESGTLYLKNLSVTSSPEIVNAISLEYQPAKSYKIGFTTVGSSRRPIAYDYFRRSFEFLNSIESKITRDQIQGSFFLPNQFVVNTFLSKSFTFKKDQKAYLLFCGLSLKNIFNTLIPILAYEQSRFDYVTLNQNKFPLKYLYDQGNTYSISLRFQTL